MAGIEVNFDLDLNSEEEVRLDMHSFLNVMNIVFGDLQIMGRILEDETCFKKSSDICMEILNAFSDKDKTIASLKNIAFFKETLLNDIAGVEDVVINDEKHRKIFLGSIKSLYNIMDIVEVRVQEILARYEVGARWDMIAEREIISRMEAFADSVALASMGRYGICFDKASQGEKDYYLNLEVKGLKGGDVFMPMVINDCFRDLTANARKYTDLGGEIHSRLIESEDKLLLSVKDNGRGIPEGEIPDVVKFGVRGSNTQQNETRGGGFGLTKAYYVCKRFGGRMWIDSALGKGTEITMEIPKPS